METFPDRETLADAGAEILAHALATPGPRRIVVTGGGTPGPVYDRLAARDLDWSRVTLTLTDERWVDTTSPLSNEKLVRERLLTGRAAEARLVPLKGDGASPEADAEAADMALRPLPPWSAVLIGMGEDGHIASLFPGDPDLTANLDPEGEKLCVGIPRAGLQPFVPRVSLTARALLSTRLLVLLITGEAKRALVERIASDPDFAPPAAALLRQDRTPVRIVWAA